MILQIKEQKYYLKYKTNITGLYKQFITRVIGRKIQEKLKELKAKNIYFFGKEFDK